MGELYLHSAQFAPAVAQFTLWIDVHERSDVHMPQALNLRCRTRALWGQQLEQALADCDAALKRSPNAAAFLDSRALVHLRRGDFDKAIADYDHALNLHPSAWSHYGRGVAEFRKGMSEQGKADIAAAVALSPNVADEAQKHGISP